MPVVVTSEVQRGRFLVGVVIIYAFVADVVTDLLARNFSLVSWLILLGLLYALWRGQRWARWLLVGLTGMAPLVGFCFLRGTPSPFFIVLLIQYVFVAALLAFPPSISVFLAFQRSQPAASNPPEKSHEPREHVDPY